MLQFSPLLWDLKAFTQTVGLCEVYFAFAGQKQHKEEQPAGCLTNKTENHLQRRVLCTTWSQNTVSIQKENLLLLVLRD